MNESKNDKVGARQTDLARKFNKAGLLSEKGLKAVESANDAAVDAVLTAEGCGKCSAEQGDDKWVSEPIGTTIDAHEPVDLDFRCRRSFDASAGLAKTMKRCPYCGKQYPDGADICPVDQQKLDNPTETPRKIGEAGARGGARPPYHAARPGIAPPVLPGAGCRFGPESAASDTGRHRPASCSRNGRPVTRRFRRRAGRVGPTPPDEAAGRACGRALRRPSPPVRNGLSGPCRVPAKRFWFAASVPKSFHRPSSG